jgi:hypothetical protein
MTPDQIHTAITDALTVRAASLRREASGHRWAGPAHKVYRDHLRNEARNCDKILHSLKRTTPGALMTVQPLADLMNP